MNAKTHLIDLAICCALVFLALLGFISYWKSNLLRGNIDGLLLLSICFLVFSIFSVQMFLIVRSLGWLAFLDKIRARRLVSLGEPHVTHTVATEGQLATRTK